MSGARARALDRNNSRGVASRHAARPGKCIGRSVGHGVCPLHRLTPIPGASDGTGVFPRALAVTPDAKVKASFKVRLEDDAGNVATKTLKVKLK